MRFALLCFLLSTTTLFAKKNFSELLTKQNINNIRFISHDGLVTYYQSRAGNLFRTRNYKTVEILKKPEGTQFVLSASPVRKKLIIQAYQNLFSVNQMLPTATLYVQTYKGDKLQEVGKGRSPRLHLEDNWLSAFNPKFKRIDFFPFEIKNSNFSINLRNKINPWFNHHALMLSESQILFTDLNDQGHAGVLVFDREKEEVYPIFKSKFPGTKIEICALEGKLVLGEFPLSTPSSGSRIYVASDLKFLRTAKFEEIYRSSQNDVGNMLCHSEKESVYFIKSTGQEGMADFAETEVAQLVKKEGKIDVEVLTDLKYVSQILTMDQRILVPFRGKYYVLHGRSNEKKDVFEKNVDIKPESKGSKK